MFPLKQLLLFVHRFGDYVGEILRHVVPAINYRSGAHDCRDWAHHASIQANRDGAALLFAFLREFREQVVR